MLGKLFITFAKIGAFTFGGGWAMISIIEREVVDKHQWLRRDEFLDLLAVAQSLPGILAVNISVVVGDKLRGLKGAIAASVGTITPCFLIILAIAMFLTPETITSHSHCNFQGHPSGGGGIDSCSGYYHSPLGRYRMENGMDPCCGGSSHMVEVAGSVEPDTVHCIGWRCGMVFHSAVHQENK